MYRESLQRGHSGLFIACYICILESLELLINKLFEVYMTDLPHFFYRI